MLSLLIWAFQEVDFYNWVIKLTNGESKAYGKDKATW
jgi:hypothetical protein